MDCADCLKLPVQYRSLEMRRFDISILDKGNGLWTGSRKMTCNSGETIIDSDKDDDHQCDVAIIMNNNINDSDKLVPIKHMNISKI